jgi:hypothetical protein
MADDIKCDRLANAEPGHCELFHARGVAQWNLQMASWDLARMVANCTMAVKLSNCVLNTSTGKLAAVWLWQVVLIDSISRKNIGMTASLEAYNVQDGETYADQHRPRLVPILEHHTVSPWERWSKHHRPSSKLILFSRGSQGPVRSYLRK